MRAFAGDESRPLGLVHKHTSKNPRIHCITPHSARTRTWRRFCIGAAFGFGERRRFSPLIPTAIGRLLFRVRPAWQLAPLLYWPKSPHSAGKKTPKSPLVAIAITHIRYIFLLFKI